MIDDTASNSDLYPGARPGVRSDRFPRRFRGSFARTRLFSALFLFFFLFFLGACVSGPPPRPQNLAIGDLSYLKEYMTWFMRQRLNQRDLVGMSFALVDDKHLLWAGGLGFADREAKIKADESTIYQVASISKMVTATAVMQLVDSGQLNLDAPLRNALPDFRINSRFAQPPNKNLNASKNTSITLRNILSHHSGLPSDYLHGFYYTERNAPENLQNRFVDLPALLKNEFVSTPPNRIFSYSNLGYSLAGAAIARVAQNQPRSRGPGRSFQAFENYVQSRIFGPLDMRDSTFAAPEWVPKNQKHQQRIARGYAGLKRTANPRLRDLAAGGLHSTATDLAKLVQMFLNQGTGPLNQKILARSSLREMLRAQNAAVTLDERFRIGAGLFLNDQEIPGQLTAGHGGDLPPFHSAVLFSPVHRLGAIVLTNSSSSSAEMNQIAAEFLRQAIQVKTGITVPARSGLPQRSANVSSEMQAKYHKYAGSYAAAFGIMQVIRESGDPDRLYLEIQGSRLELIPRVDGGFSVQYRLLGLIPIDIPGLNQMRIHFRIDPASGTMLAGIFANRIPITLATPVPAAQTRSELPPAWRARLGSYKVCNDSPGLPAYDLLRNIKLIYDPETKVLKLATIARLLGEEAMILPLRWLNDSEAIVYGLGRNQGDTVRVDPNANSVLWYSGFRLCLAAKNAK